METPPFYSRTDLLSTKKKTEEWRPSWRSCCSIPEGYITSKKALYAVPPLFPEGQFLTNFIAAIFFED